MTPEVRTRSVTRYTIGAMAGVAILAAAAYLPVLSTGFTSDDFFILSRVRALNGLEHPLAYFRFGFFDYYRPLVFLSHAIDWEIWGLDPVGYHLRSLLFHAGCSVLVFLIGRRFLSLPMAAVAAALFALHPASHEAVYWMAARFDLMATFFTLVAIGCLVDERPLWRAVGVVAFALGLLSKESAVSLLIIAPAWDVFVAKRSLRDVVRRLVPLLVVVAVYAVVRTLGADLEAAGGGRRLPKALMALGLLGWVLFVGQKNRLRESISDPPQSEIDSRSRFFLVTVTVVLTATLVWSVTSDAVARLLGFAAYVIFYFVSPIVFPSPPAWVFTPIVWQDALIGLAMVLALMALALRFRHSLARHSEVLFLCVFIAAALLPVSSMAGGLRYLYLPTAGVTLLAGWLLDRAGGGRLRWIAAVSVTAVIVISLSQLMEAGRRWRAGAEMQRSGILLMAEATRPCDGKDVVLLTTPNGIGGVYANFLYEAFGVLTDCKPRSFATLLRVVGSDVHVDVVPATDGSIELRVPDYRGNILASADLSTFLERITPGRRLSLDTTIGHLDTFGDGSTQIFRIALNPESRAAARFYYSDGAIHRFFKSGPNR